jgi:uncharacterized repeat protein (TIGR03803 family)
MSQARPRRLRIALLAATSLAITPAAASAAKVTYTILFSFQQGANGYQPSGKPLLDAKGDIFGTTLYGGTGGYGTVYSFTANAAFTVLHAFTGTTGAEPRTGVIANAAGDLFGNTLIGGKANAGILFQLGIHGGTYQAESLQQASGYDLTSGLVADAAGNLYGMAALGGAANLGTVYKVKPNGALSALHSFTGGADGENPRHGSLAEDAAGNLYGTTYHGGANNGGVMFKVTPAGQESVLYAFSKTNNACYEPNNSVALDAAGNLYGSTISGGPYSQGCVYRLAPDGTFTLLHAFSGTGGGGSDGASPHTGVTLDANANIYGVTTYGGYDNDGTIYRITASGQYSLLYSYTGGMDGTALYASELAISPAGAIIGVNQGGGAYGSGNLFSLSP